MPCPKQYTSEPLLEIIRDIELKIANDHRVFSIWVANPDLGKGAYSGHFVSIEGVQHRHRSFRVWVDLAERMGLRLATPRSCDSGDQFDQASKQPTGLVELTFERLDFDKDMHKIGRCPATEAREKYGSTSAYQKISKHEDPGYVLDMADVVQRLALPEQARILSLGVNRGDELQLLLDLEPNLASACFVGVDHSSTAIREATQRFTTSKFPNASFSFLDCDLNDLPNLDVGTFDLVMSMGTLQSPGVRDRDLMHHIVKSRLKPTGSVLIGVPNCRYIDGEVEYGARMKNYSQPELSTVVKDAAFFRRYLQQHGRLVHITGKNYLLVTAISDRHRLRDRLQG